MSEIEAIATRIREMREGVKFAAKNQGISLSDETKQSYYMNGKIQGLTDILILIDPDPFN